MTRDDALNLAFRVASVQAAKEPEVDEKRSQLLYVERFHGLGELVIAAGVAYDAALAHPDQPSMQKLAFLAGVNVVVATLLWFSRFPWLNQMKMAVSDLPEGTTRQ